MNPAFWNGRRVLLTGHTGFKGAWMAILLSDMGATVTGAALDPEGDETLWDQISSRLSVADQRVDMRDQSAVADLCRKARPEIVLHLAAQAQVRTSYAEPVETFASNVMGTVNLLDALRTADDVAAILVVTSDKVYRNDDQGAVFDESATLGGSDPYSASKAAAEHVVRAYAESYFSKRNVAVATARGGNVVGGGDFASDRLAPDLFRAARAGEPVELRYPEATRPWQHVLDCLSGYVNFAEHLRGAGATGPAALNFGPDSGAHISVAAFSTALNTRLGNARAYRKAPGEAPPEKTYLMLDNARAKMLLGWAPRLDFAATIDWTADWYAAYAAGADPLDLTRKQLSAYRDLPPCA